MNKQASPIQQLCMTIDQMRSKFKETLPPAITPEAFAAKTKNAIQRHPQSEDLVAADRASLFNAMLKAAEDGLLLDGREATLTVFKSKHHSLKQVQYMPMVQGLIKLARNSGEIKKIYADIVYDNDEFHYCPQESKLTFDPDWFGERGEPKGAFCLITLTNGEVVHSIMPKRRILQIGDQGRNSFQYDVNNGKNFEEWWKKTVIKNALKYAPSSTLIDEFIHNDNEREGFDFDQPKDITEQPAPEATPTAAESLVIGADDTQEGDLV